MDKKQAELNRDILFAFGLIYLFINPPLAGVFLVGAWVFHNLNFPKS